MIKIPKISIKREGNVTKEDVNKAAKKAGEFLKDKASNLKNRLAKGFSAFAAPVATTE